MLVASTLVTAGGGPSVAQLTTSTCLCLLVGGLSRLDEPQDLGPHLTPWRLEHLGLTQSVPPHPPLRSGSVPLFPQVPTVQLALWPR